MILDVIIRNSPLLYFTQSLWRDEVFSILVSEHPISWIITKLSLEPPVYYFLLHFWMKIFGNGEITVRSLSLICVMLSTILIIYWSEKLFKNKTLQIVMPLSFFLNPMIIYYAFEVRTYGLYILLTTLSLYAYWQKKYLLFIVSSVLGFYTHSYFIFLFFSQALHWLIYLSHNDIKKYRNLFKIPIFRSAIISFILFLPWSYKLISKSGELKSSWYYPVDMQLVKSVLGNVFVGYEGTPWFLWKYTTILSILLFITFGIALFHHKLRQLSGLFFITVFLPLIIVVGFSFLKPLYVNRYMIPVTISEIFLVFIAIDMIDNKYIKSLSGIIVLICSILFNIWYPKEHAKVAIRPTIQEINKIKSPDDLYYASSSLNLFEIIYYSQDRDKVFLYNPDKSPFPVYVGKAVFKDSYMVSDIPNFPKKAFLINTDGTYKVLFKIPEKNQNPSN